MFMPVTTKTENPAGEVTTRLLTASIVETTYRGHASKRLVESVLALTPTVLKEAPGTRWLLDMQGVTGVEIDARFPGLKLLEQFKAGGGQQFAAVIPHPGIRMLISAVALAARYPIKMFENREAALAFLREKV